MHKNLQKALKMYKSGATLKEMALTFKVTQCRMMEIISSKFKR